MGRDTIQDRVGVVQSAAYDREGYHVSYLLCDERTDMAERSQVKFAGADYSKNIILERQLTVQCHAENTELVHERNIRACDHNAIRPVEFGDLLSGTSFMIASVLLGLRSRSFSRCQLVTASTHADRFVNLSDRLSLIAEDLLSRVKN